MSGILDYAGDEDYDGRYVNAWRWQPRYPVGSCQITENFTLAEVTPDFIIPAESYFDLSYDATRNKWIAVGTGGVVLVSENRRDWTQLSQPNGTADLQYLAVQPGGILIVSSGLYLYRSEDFGASWQQVAYFSTGFAVKQLIYGNGIFVCITQNDIYKSTDFGVSWTLLYSPATWISGANYGNFWLFVSTNVTELYSTDNLETVISKSPAFGSSVVKVMYDTISAYWYAAVPRGGLVRRKAVDDDWVVVKPQGDAFEPEFFYIARAAFGLLAVTQQGEYSISYDGEVWSANAPLANLYNNVRAFTNGTCMIVSGSGSDGGPKLFEAVG